MHAFMRGELLILNSWKFVRHHLPRRAGFVAVY
jgi:hypothetical protein